jgi:hypothetical protein
MPILTPNKTTREFEGSTRNRERAEAEMQAMLARNRAIAGAHRAPGGGVRADVTIDRPRQPDGSVKGGG